MAMLMCVTLAGCGIHWGFVRCDAPLRRWSISEDAALLERVSFSLHSFLTTNRGLGARIVSFLLLPFRTLPFFIAPGRVPFHSFIRSFALHCLLFVRCNASLRIVPSASICIARWPGSYAGRSLS